MDSNSPAVQRRGRVILAMNAMFTSLPLQSVSGRWPFGAPAPGRDAPARHHHSMTRGVEALQVLLKSRRSLGITQLATALGLSKSTTHDLAAALSNLGFVEQDQVTRRYSVSPEIFRFLNMVSTEFGPNPELRPVLRKQARLYKVSIVVTTLSRQTTFALCASGPSADTFFLGDNGRPIIPPAEKSWLRSSGRKPGPIFRRDRATKPARLTPIAIRDASSPSFALPGPTAWRGASASGMRASVRSRPRFPAGISRRRMPSAWFCRTASGLRGTGRNSRSRPRQLPTRFRA